MREAFPYESNGFLLSKFLVPDPIPREKWEKELTDWKLDPADESLLGRMVRKGLTGKEQYLNVMQQSLGVQVETGDLGAGDFEDIPEGTMLKQFGFIQLPPRNGKRCLAGGPDLPPALGKYLGKSAADWQWLMVPPVLEKRGIVEAQFNIADIPGHGISETGTWLDQLLQTCHAKGASDLHLERSGSSVRARIRTHAGMQEIGRWPSSVASAPMRLIKEWSGIPTSENSLPSDRRLRRKTGTNFHSFRVSHLGTVDGESLVLRQLTTTPGIRSLEELGVPVRLQVELIKCIRRDPGMVLFTGPTGSGKTTTLYGLLSQLPSTSGKILTIEDPIEHELPNATQSAVDDRNGWTFDRAVRAFLRQDPDVIVLGEMRDKSSAEAACRAALTGHAVLATLHSKCESSALDRLAGWGLPRGIIAEVVRLVVNQRLVPSGSPDGSGRARFTWTNPKLVH